MCLKEDYGLHPAPYVFSRFDFAFSFFEKICLRLTEVFNEFIACKYAICNTYSACYFC